MADKTKMFTLVVVVFVFIAIFFTFISQSYGSFVQGLNSINLANNCSDTTGASLNESNDVCINSTLGYISEAEFYELPLNDLWATDGIVALLVMGGLLLLGLSFGIRAFLKR